jgi:DNA-directed RNA polymerase subunit RPC12/RpoP
MRIESLNCNHCGAPLEVPQSANYVKCNHCGSQLVIHRSESATFTETVEQLAETTENLAAQVSKLTRQNEVEALDRQWEREKESYMVTNKHGAKHLPSRGGATAAGVMVCVFGVIWTIMAVAITSGAPDVGPFQVAKFAFPAFGVAFIIFGIFMAMNNYRKAQEYERAYRRYRQRRDELSRE